MARLTLILSVLMTVIGLLGGFRLVMQELRDMRERKRLTGRWLLIIVVATFGMWFMPEQGMATTCAASLSTASIQGCINSAGVDLVTVPAGVVSISPTLTISGKTVTLQGAGKASTFFQCAGNGACLNIGASASNFVRITGINFSPTAYNSDGMVTIDGTRFDVAFRFDHNTLTHSAAGRGMSITNVFGLIDHNDILVTGSAGLQSISVYGSSASNDQGFTPWTRPLALGTDQAVYIEDNYFENAIAASGGEDTMDFYNGARWVIRNNQFVNTHFGNHGLDSGSTRSPLSFEVYNNTFTNNTGSVFAGFHVRGGSGVIHDNVWDGTTGFPGWALIYARWDLGDSNVSYWQHCTGADYELGYPVVSDNLAHVACTATGWTQKGCSETGVNYPNGPDVIRTRFLSTNRDMLCTSGATCTEYLDGNSANGYPCRDQPGIAPGQIVSGIFMWNESGPRVADIGSGYSNIQLNRDYFKRAPQAGDYIYPYVPLAHPHYLQGLAPEPPTAPGRLILRFAELVLPVMGVLWHFRKALLAGCLTVFIGGQSLASTLRIALPRYTQEITTQAKQTTVRVILLMLRKE